MVNAIDRREFYRHPLHLSFQVTTDGAAEPSQIRAKDVSLGGVGFESRSPLPVHDSLTIHLLLKENKYSVKARVAYCQLNSETGYFRVGLTFIDSPVAFRSRLSHLFYEVYEYHTKLRQNLDPSLSEETAADRWLTENQSLFAA